MRKVITLSIWLFVFLAISPASYGQQEIIVRKTEENLRANATVVVEPRYPALAKTAQVEGEVHVEVIIDYDGTVYRASVIDGHALLQQSALQAAIKWRFKPFLFDAKPVRASGILTFGFDLNRTPSEESVESAQKQEQAESSERQTKMPKGKGLAQQTAVIENRIAFFKRMRMRQKGAIAMLSAINARVPAGVKLDSIKERDNLLTIVGSTNDESLISTFAKDMEFSNNLFTKVDVQSELLHSNTARMDQWKFTLSCKYHPLTYNLSEESVSLDSDSKLKKRYEQSRADLEALTELIPESSTISKVLVSIHDQAFEQRLVLKTFQPGDVFRKDFYRKKPVYIQVTGLYNDLFRFFESIAVFRNICYVSDIDINKVNEQNENRDIDASFTINILFADKGELTTINGTEPKIDEEDGPTDLPASYLRKPKRDPFREEFPSLERRIERYEQRRKEAIKTDGKRPDRTEPYLVNELSLAGTYSVQAIQGAIFQAPNKEEFAVNIGANCFNGKFIGIKQGQALFEEESLTMDDSGNSQTSKTQVVKKIESSCFENKTLAATSLSEESARMEAAIAAKLPNLKITLKATKVGLYSVLQVLSKLSNDQFNFVFDQSVPLQLCLSLDRENAAFGDLLLAILHNANLTVFENGGIFHIAAKSQAEEADLPVVGISQTGPPSGKFGAPDFHAELVTINASNVSLGDLLRYIGSVFGVKFTVPEEAKQKNIVAIQVSDIEWTKVLVSSLKATRMALLIEGDNVTVMSQAKLLQNVLQGKAKAK